MTIKKKIWPEFFKAVAFYNKRFEIRKDEDDIQAGDGLILEEWDPRTEKYTGRSLSCIVGYVFRGDNYEQDFGLKPGYCIIGFWLG